jgi:phosphonate ABC transporter permease subunit PhnE
MKKKSKSPFLHSIKVAFIIIGLIILYAIGFSVTKVNLEETKSEIRQKQLIRIIRALVQPDLFTYDTVDTLIQTKILAPCSENAFTGIAMDPTTSDPYLTLSTYCANPGDAITIEGFNFEVSEQIFVQFIPPNGVKLTLGQANTDENGHFILETKIPKNRKSDQPQTIQVKTSVYAGNLKISGTLKDTWDKIVETLFLALLSTTVGCIFALPLSFFAAKNLMERLKTEFISVSLTLILFPIGFYIGLKIVQIIIRWISTLTISPIFVVIGCILLAVIIFLLLRQLFSNQKIPGEHTSYNFRSILSKSTAAITVVVFCILLSKVFILAGDSLAKSLGTFAFIGEFIRDMGEILEMILPVGVGIAASFIAVSLGSKISKSILAAPPIWMKKIISVVLSVAAYAGLCLLIINALNFLYEFKNIREINLYTGMIGGLVGLMLGLIFQPNYEIKIGNVIYIITRSVFNILRSIESLVMVIVFVVWVGIGPFAGSLALALHTIAALGKMYSEQVENISEGPLEAIQATGANLVQQVVYAVIPQIIPPYIAFTLYRWDQNVRMSTIIGFAGGGGIGFLLQQNINLLNYRAASVQMIAIAVVVSLMDYLSGYVRNKIV